MLCVPIRNGRLFLEITLVRLINLSKNKDKYDFFSFNVNLFQKLYAISSSCFIEDKITYIYANEIFLSEMICVGPNDNNRTCEDYGVNIWYEVNVFPNYNRKF